MGLRKRWHYENDGWWHDDMKPKKNDGGGVARGTGAAVKGTGFKGVY